MSLPASFLAAVATRDFKVARWLEIEGIPYAYGDHAFSGSFFASRAAANQFLGCKAAFEGVPPIEDQELDTLDGVPRKSGVVDFSILDGDDAPVLWTGVGNVTGCMVAVEISDSDTSLVYVGDGSAIPSTGTLYLGTETISYSGHNTGTKTFSGLTRGLYRSKAQAFGVGFPIGVAPYTMSQRRCWYYLVAVPFTQASFSAEDANKVLRFSGLLTKYRMSDDSPAVFIATVETLERELSNPCFRTFRDVPDYSEVGIADGQGLGGGLVPEETFWSPVTVEMEDDEDILVRVDDEILHFRRDGSQLELIAGGLYRTLRPGHKRRFVGKEVIGITAAGSGHTSLEAAASYFSSAVTAAVPYPADHPLMVLLQILLSTGLGTNTPGGGARNYDVLPESYGMAFDYDRVDIAGIEKLTGEDPDLRIGGLIEESINFIDLARSILKPIGYYGSVSVEGLFTVKKLRPPLPDEATRAITNNNRIRDAHPGYDSNLSGPVQTIEFKYGWDIAKKTFRRIRVFQITEAGIHTKGKGRKLSYESKLLYTGQDGIPGEPRRQTVVPVPEMLLKRVDFFRTRYSRPPPIVNEVVDYSFIDVELGELVAITSTQLPNPASGTRGMTGAVGEIISKRIDEESKRIDLTILMTGYQLGDYRFIAPSLEIESLGGSDEEVVVKANAFTEDINGQTDLLVLDSSGDLLNTFLPGADVKVWSADFSQMEVVTLNSMNGATFELVFDAAPSFGFAVGQYITLGSFADSPGFTDVYAFLDVDHLYFPS